MSTRTGAESVTSLRTVAIALTAAVAAAAGCSQSPASDPAAPPAAPYGAAVMSSPAAAPAVVTGAPVAEPAPVTAPPMAAAPDASPAGPPSAGGPVGAAPFMGMGSPTSPLTPTPDKDKAIADAEKSGDKKAVAAAYTDRGVFRMNDAKAGARVKYRAALDDYRKALAADPSNADAKKNKDMIESIYKSMGRPIPGADGGK